MSGGEVKVHVSGAGAGSSTLLFLLFLTLKLLGKITWSWWWVTSPLWIPASFVVVFLIVIGLVVWKFS